MSPDPDPSTAPGRAALAPLADLVAGRAGHRHPGAATVVGVTGGVAVGKSTIARRLRSLLATEAGLPVEVVSSDGFLFSNAELVKRGLMARKGFPESYDNEAIERFLAAVHSSRGPIEVPLYDHFLSDVAPTPTVIDHTGVVVFEGVNALRFDSALEVGVYVDAAEADMRRWYLERVIEMRRQSAVAAEPSPFFASFASLPEEDFRLAVLGVWEAVNLPNLRDYIEPTRADADVVVVKGPDHDVVEVRLRP